ncbi:hypothetical protein ORJ04_04515 [Rheinheimera baltica]|uniref:Uncharacterized protein n=1 Tax=Rheinheimera baltica TaxID=67576 RepID=A0ABT9HVQ9_9GAMM|nr:hypothetical protein [Rheinheimera baltica]MDP5135212.1 hypothetical protein [Rheinheimera baltica]MDP5151556.1 hypothetical protein [Rheinheimera baltica]
MLIDKLLRRRRQRVQHFAEQGAQLQQTLQAQQWLLKQRASAFIVSAPGLLLSFSVGCLFQLRHNNAVKTLHRVVGLRRLTKWFIL